MMKKIFITAMSFASMLLLGTAIATFFSHQQSPSGFTKTQALSHLKKRVKDRCSQNFERTTGRTMYFEKDNFQKQFAIVIDWDVSFRGKHELISYVRDSYEKCIVEVGDVDE